MPRRILIVEDEAELASLVADYLAVEGIPSEVRADGLSGLEAALSGAYDLVILDLMLPRLDGFEFCRRLRASSDMPIIIVSARREDGDKIRGLGFGADDYVTKPFSPAELVARVKGQLARYDRLTGKAGGSADRWVADGGLEVNFEARRVRKAGAELALTAKEFEILSLFMRNPGRAFPKDEIYQKAWGDELYGDGTTVTVHIRRLREKIEDDPSRPERIETVWGIGYRWRAPLS